MSAPPSSVKRYSHQNQQHQQQQQQGRPSTHTPPLHSPTKSVMNQLPVFTPGMPVCRTHFSSSSSPATGAATSGKYPSSGSSTTSAPALKGPTARPASMIVTQRPSESYGHPFVRAGQSGPPVGHAASKSLDLNRSSNFSQGVFGGKTKIDLDFEAMMDALEVPSAVRTKMNTMEQHVKSAFLKNSQSFQLATGMSARPIDSYPIQPPGSSSASSFKPNNLESAIARDSDYFLIPKSQSVLGSNHSVGNQQNPTLSFIRHPTDRDQGNKQRGKGKKAGQERNSVIQAESLGGSAQNSPMGMAKWLRDGPPASVMDLGKVKKLRMLLRQETTLWVETFLHEGGYVLMLRKLTEVLEMEWREEQHDDQLLHELLRCIKALATSDVGCLAIRQHAPAPFIPLTTLLFSDKKPGDVPTRQLMTELILLLFDLFPVESNCGVSQEWATLPEFVRRLLVGPEKENDLVEFVTIAHRPRVFKTYLTEIADVCRDYFWMFCHANGIWRLADLDISQVERPTAPGGATGGVEYEAGNYLTVHFKLVNAQARACYELNESSESDTSAWRFHAQLFESGFDRIILSTRKASTTYYPHLHLELARYIALAQQARYDLPYQVQRLIEPPPVNFQKVNGRDSEGLPSQGLNGGKFGPDGRRDNYIGNGLPSRANEPGTAPASGQRNQIDDRFVFQAPAGRHQEAGAGGRKFSPAPQLNRNIVQSDSNSLLA